MNLNFIIGLIIIFFDSFSIFGFSDFIIECDFDVVFNISLNYTAHYFKIFQNKQT